MSYKKSVLISTERVFIARAGFGGGFGGVGVVVRHGLTVILQPFDARGHQCAGGRFALVRAALLGGDESKA